MLGEPPFTVGWDVSGVVDKVGFGVTTLREGEQAAAAHTRGESNRTRGKLVLRVAS
ncbi:alcohol dehydrogenase catalytic domain-containing protein [Amycolatopsis lexingtonensis]|uniref:alcohol dehydrogenase catalytic domain-containing protein n=1 Tax=Amycolatopsis lexingtonensis TaxID=218822 RepID=UPI003F6F4899